MKKKILVTLGMVLALVLAACGGKVEAKGNVVFAVTDAAANMGAVTEVKVTIDSLRVHSEGGAWTSISTGAKTFNLLELNAEGTAQLLAQASLEAGTYDQMELNVSKVIVVDAQGEHEAKLPSNKLQIKGTLDVNAGSTATASFDFIAHQSLHVTGEGTFILAPVVKVETKADAQATVQSDNTVTISGGQTTSDVKVGMDVEGNVDVGLRITPDAVLSVAASGKVVQIKGQALATGAIKSVDTSAGIVTITTRGGADLVLNTSGNSEIKVDHTPADVSALAADIGAEAAVRYNIEARTIAAIAANADNEAKAEIGSKLDLRGTVTSVNTADSTVTVTTDSGANVVVTVAPGASIDVGGIAVGVSGLGSLLGAQVEGQFSTDTGAATTITAPEPAPTPAPISVAGTLKAVNSAAGTVTIVTQAGTDVVLNVASDTRLLAKELSGNNNPIFN